MTSAAFGAAMSSIVVVVLRYHLHGYASISLANNSLEKETSYRASKLLEPSSELLAVLSTFRDVNFSVLSIVRSKSGGKQKYGLLPPRLDVSVAS
jgi:hypothetical protein